MSCTQWDFDGSFNNKRSPLKIQSVIKFMHQFLTSFCFFPWRLILFQSYLFFNLGFFIKFIEIVDNDRNRKRNAQDSTKCTTWWKECYINVSYMNIKKLNRFVILTKKIDKGTFSRNIFCKMLVKWSPVWFHNGEGLS